MIPFERRDARRRRPEIRRDVDFEGAGRGVVEGGDDDGAVDVFGGVVEDFPAACWGPGEYELWSWRKGKDDA